MSLRRRLRDPNYFPRDSDPGAEQWHDRHQELWALRRWTPRQSVELLQLTNEERDAARDAYELMKAIAEVEAREPGFTDPQGWTGHGINSAQLIDKITLAINAVRWQHAHENLAWHAGEPRPALRSHKEENT
jgi:hypothetical protein